MPRSTGRRGDDVPICGECGQRHLTRYGTEACAGHVTHDRESYTPGQDRKKLDEPRPCESAPHFGATVCKAHGARAKQVQQAGQRRAMEAKVAELVRRFGGPLDVAPTEALLDTVKWTAGYVGWLRERVGEDAPDIPLGAWDAVLGEWSDRLVKVCTEAIRAGIEERRVRLAEAQGALVAEVIRKILGDLELTPEQARKAGQVVPLRLREVAAS